ncbi:hypothetical protein PVAP13_8KG019301 [Panicum virgatum]|uniref:Uncharacterized protein n=1 Tax=Panicum virgatum TaxID=38727 RepID=A0A8T0PDB0_PANVG|nr:hypothetical protein PVAP13_8KG019301 [Panicum virgatum]
MEGEEKHSGKHLQATLENGKIVTVVSCQHGIPLPNACYSTWFPRGSDWVLTESPRRVSTTAMDLSNIFIVVDREPCKRQQLSGLELAAKASSS